ncbi:similar to HYPERSENSITIVE TO ABA1 [Actinidia rufa]|uniref:protein-serine/threonine phosphatase n=1 Tax=Actinidia rufa TaxID=165716 RepID=A0A7J0FAB4_9ERIC|nr:similar to HYPERSENSITIVE TO ABA1 [Actinidia rufa]
MSRVVVVPLRLATLMDITRLKFMANTTRSFSDSAIKNSADYGSSGDEECDFADSEGEVSVIAVSVPVVGESDEDDSLSLEGDQILDSSCSLSVVSDTSSLCGDDLFTFEVTPEIGTPSFINVEKSFRNVERILKGTDMVESNIEGEIVNEPLAAAVSLGEEIGDGSSSKSSTVVLKLPSEQGLTGIARKSVFEVDYVPLWGSTSICGRRPEMEDAFATVPRFLKIPIQMLIGDRVLDGMNNCLSHLTAHLFGVYDGHGGSQVANYCCDRLHSALAEELEIVMASLSDGNMKDNCQELWTKALTNCFLKVDAEVGGIGSLEPVAPETVGSTAVVAIVCSSHIIVANCGDSRAVLCRGKEPVGLSVDHKPNREDEHTRIEAAGGKVIQWNGHRVFGVLAMSRSIVAATFITFLSIMENQSIALVEDET